MKFIHWPVRVIRAVLRILIFVLVSLIASLVALSFRAVGAPHRYAFSVYNTWKRWMGFLLSVKITYSGPIPDQATILMANHRSYVDVLMFRTLIPAVFVAKAEVSKWPVVAWGANALRTVWVDRKSQESRRKTREQLRLRLEEGISVIIFPEGTTHHGPELLPFKPGMFHTCAEGGFPIVPIAMEYRDPDISWTGKQLFIPHFLEQFGKPRIEVQVRYGAPVTGTDGEALREEVFQWVQEQVYEMRQDWDSRSQA